MRQRILTIIVNNTDDLIMANNKRRCRDCKEYTVAELGLLVNGGYYCNFDCAISYANKNKAKGAKIKHTAQKKGLNDNDKALRMKCAQKAFNAFIRKRDESDGCISCNKTKDWTGQWHAGHFKTTKARGDIRFNEDNCHKQCSVCNNYLSGNIGEYQPKLIAKIGTVRFLALTLHKVKSYSCAELKSIELEYQDKIKSIRSIQDC